jgi:hypothetical protein
LARPLTEKPGTALLFFALGAGSLVTADRAAASQLQKSVAAVLRGAGPDIVEAAAEPEPLPSSGQTPPVPFLEEVALEESLVLLKLELLDARVTELLACGSCLVVGLGSCPTYPTHTCRRAAPPRHTTAPHRCTPFFFPKASPSVAFTRPYAAVSGVQCRS